jgi:alpha-L-fucosidase
MNMDRRKFLLNGTLLSGNALIGSSGFPSMGRYQYIKNLTNPFSKFTHRLPKSNKAYLSTSGYIEDDPVKEYTWASDKAYESFLDLKFGIRLHWGLYSILQQQGESWPYLSMSLEERQAYQELYKSWYPENFDAGEWMDFFADSGAKMFAFTSKHHDGFSLFDTKTRVKRRANWLAPGGPVIEECDQAYSIMDTPFRRDIIKELCNAAHKKDIKINLYFSHPDWHDADFRPYNRHPLQVPGAARIAVTGKEMRPQLQDPKKQFGKSGVVIVPDPTKEQVDRMMKRHRTQLEELITKYGTIDMVDLDIELGPQVWPQLRETMLYLRKLRPDVMYRVRGIGNYGDYYTPEGFVPGDKENTDTPWFVIYPLGRSFSYEPRSDNYKGEAWVIKNLVDAASKGGNFMAGIGPDGTGKFHRAAITQLKRTGAWLRINGQGIYATRARDGDLWKEGDNIRFTRSKDNQSVYAFSFKWPEEKLILRSVKPKKNAKIYLMGIPRPLNWRYDSSQGLIIETPGGIKSRLPDIAHLCYGFKIPVERT